MDMGAGGAFDGGVILLSALLGNSQYSGRE
jgi:hypothetical protein